MIRRLATAGLVLTVGAVLAACGSATASTTTSKSTAAASAGRGFRGAAGQLVRIDGATLIVSGASGDTTVTYGDATMISETRSETVANITVGECIAATGTAQSGGGIAVDSVRVSQQINGSCAGGFGGGGPRPSPRPGFSPPPQFANRAAVRGTVESVSGTSVTVKSASGAAQVITIPTTVTVTVLQTVQPSSLETGQCVLAIGSRSASGNVSARSITIVPAGPNGCLSGRGSFGGFPGGRGFPGGGAGGGSGDGAGSGTSST